MVLKNCVVCGDKFDAMGNYKSCSPECAKELAREREKKFRPVYNQRNKEKSIEELKSLSDDKKQVPKCPRCGACGLENVRVILLWNMNNNPSTLFPDRLQCVCKKCDCIWEHSIVLSNPPLTNEQEMT